MNRKTRAERIGSLIGKTVGTAATIYSGYVWAKHGVLWGAAVFFGFLVCAFALYGISKWPWGER